MDVSNQVAVVTGGSRGIGRATCIQLAKAGAHVVINYAGNEGAAKETQKQCEQYGVQAVLVQGNVALEADVDRLFEEALKINGRIDILVNNAGIKKDNILLRMKTEEFDDVINVNLKGAFLCMKKASRIMLKQRYGRIINLSSVVGLRGNIGQLNYAASKAGVIGMTKSLAKELAARNVTVNVIAPGMIATEMTEEIADAAKEAILSTIPMGKPGEAEDVANAIVFFASKEAAYLTGQVLCVDGGMAV